MEEEYGKDGQMEDPVSTERPEEEKDLNLFRCQGKIRGISYEGRSVEVTVVVFEVKDHPVEFEAVVRDPKILISDAVEGKTVFMEGYITNVPTEAGWYEQKFFVTSIQPAKRDLWEFIGPKAERVSEPFFRFYMIGTPVRIKDTGNGWKSVIMRNSRGDFVRMSAYCGGTGLRKDKILRNIRTAVCCKANSTLKPVSDGRRIKVTNIVIQEAVPLDREATEAG